MAIPTYNIENRKPIIDISHNRRGKGKSINMIKKNIVKQSILEGKSYKQSCIDAGYSINTAVHSGALSVVKRSLEELKEEFKREEITPEYVLAGLKRELETAPNSADRIRALELFGKYLALWTERSINQNTNINKEEQELRLRKLFDISPVTPNG